MRLGIDARYLSHGLTGGVHLYVGEMVTALIEQAAGHEIFLYADTKRPFEIDRLPPHVTLRRLPYRSPLSSVVNDCLMHRHMARDRVDVVHFPANYGFGPDNARVVITLHDAINILPLREIIRGGEKTARTMAMITYLHVCTRLALRKVDLVVTVSEFSKRAILEHARLDPARVVALTQAPSRAVRRIDDEARRSEVRARYGLTRPFVLADALKNPAVLVDAWRRLPAALRDAHEIVFFSRRPNPAPVIHEAIGRREARLLVLPPDEDLMALYSMAGAFVFPSWTEGFGLPLLEAMTCGAPVIASDRGSIPEVSGDAALMCDAHDAATFARYIEQVLTTPALAADLQRRGYVRARLFTWPAVARRLWQAYSQALALRAA